MTPVAIARSWYVPKYSIKSGIEKDMAEIDDDISLIHLLGKGTIKRRALSRRGDRSSIPLKETKPRTDERSSTENGDSASMSTKEREKECSLENFSIRTLYIRALSKEALQPER